MSKSKIFITLVLSCQNSLGYFTQFKAQCIKDPEKFFTSKNLLDEYNSLDQDEKLIFKNEEMFFKLLVKTGYKTDDNVRFQINDECCICGVKLPFKGISSGYPYTCSKECAGKYISSLYQNLSEEEKQNRRDCIAKGQKSISPDKRKEIINKRKNTLLETTGFENNSQDPKNKAKIRETYNNKTWEEKQSSLLKGRNTREEKYGDPNYNNKEKRIQTRQNWSEEKRQEVTLNCSNGQLNRSKESWESSIEKMRKTNLKNMGVISHAQKGLKHIDELYLDIMNADSINVDLIISNFCDPIKRIFFQHEAKEYFNIKSSPILDKIRNLIKPLGYNTYRRNGVLENKFILELEENTQKNIIRQYRIQDTRYHADGYDPETNTVYEFLGDYWHGHLRFPRNKINKKNQLTMEYLYNYTFERFDMLKSLGYTIKYIWESDYKKFGLNELKEH